MLGRPRLFQQGFCRHLKDSTLILLMLLLPCGSAASSPFQLVKLPEYVQSHGARCLDGSPASFYLQAQNMLKDSFIIDFEGGGWCYGSDADPTNPLPDCAARAKTAFGSSTALPTDCPGYFCNGMVSANPNFNADFANWTKVFVNYCDGLSFTGDRDDSVHDTTTGTDLWFRGKRNLIAVLAELATNHGLDKAARVIVSGNSAGGLTVYLHLDQIAAMLHTLAPAAKVYGFPDGGYFLDLANVKGVRTFRAKMQAAFLISNASSGIDPSCKAANANEMVNCIFAHKVAPHLKTPFFGLEAQYDSWQLGNILELTDSKGQYAVPHLTGSPTAECQSDSKCMADFQGFRNSMTKLFQPVIDKANGGATNDGLRHGVFFGACIAHCEASVDGGNIWGGGTTHWSVANRTVAQAFGDCYFRQVGCVSVDKVRWPHNPTCLHKIQAHESQYGGVSTV